MKQYGECILLAYILLEYIFTKPRHILRTNMKISRDSLPSLVGKHHKKNHLYSDSLVKKKTLFGIPIEISSETGKKENSDVLFHKIILKKDSRREGKATSIVSSKSNGIPVHCCQPQAFEVKD